MALCANDGVRRRCKPRRQPRRRCNFECLSIGTPPRFGGYRYTGVAAQAFAASGLAAYRRATMRTPRHGLLLGVAALALGARAACVPQERIAGRAKIIDGDSFEIGSTRRAPVRRRRARRPPSLHARRPRVALRRRRRRRAAQLVGSRDRTCTRRDEDDYGRIVAVCRSGTTDLGAAMVRAGLAVGVSPLQQRLRRRGARGAHGAARRLGRRVHGSRGLSRATSDGTPRAAPRRRRRNAQPRATAATSKATSTAKASASITCPARRRTTTPSSTRRKRRALVLHGSRGDAQPVGARRAASE